MTSSNIHQSFLPVMTQIAREAGALLMSHFNRHIKIEYKGEADLVTVGRPLFGSAHPRAHSPALADP